MQIQILRFGLGMDFFQIPKLEITPPPLFFPAEYPLTSGDYHMLSGFVIKHLFFDWKTCF